MKSTHNMYMKVSIVFATIFSMRALSFAGNTISDVPSSASELRTIQAETSLYADNCDITQNLVFYAWSPVYLRLSQPRTNASYVFDKAETYVRVYNKDVFGANVKFPYVSNFIPSTNVEPTSTNIISVDATWWVFSWWAITTPRTEIAWQLVTKNMLRTVIFNNNGASLSYYYRRSSNNTVHNGTKVIIINSSLTEKTSCTNYYVGRCGDGTIDTPAWGIDIPGEWFKAWHTYSIDPNEVCDDGALNGTPGKCKKDCTGIGWETPPTGGATCTLTASAAEVTSGQNVTLTASFTSGATASFSPELAVTPAFTYPTWNGTATATPTTTTTYTLNVGWANGLSGTSCSTTVTVNQPVPHLQCTLTFGSNPAYVGQIVPVWWNIQNGVFFWTYMYVSPAVGGTRPLRIDPTESNGVTVMTPTHTWDYTFTMMINNNQESAVCTWVLHVLENTPSACTLTTNPAAIMPGQPAILNASFSNASAAIMTPNISWLNFLFPARSNSNIVVNPTVTTTYTLTTIGNFGTTWGVCTATVNVVNTWVTLKKTLVANTLYRPGDLVTFKIEFANQWASTVNNVVVTDYLPAGLEYVNSQIYGVAPFVYGIGVNGGNQYVEYSWFSLTPGQQGYIILIGRFKWYEYANQTLNNAFLTYDNSPMMYASALFNAYAPNGNASVSKTSDKTSYFPGEDARFTIAVTNNWPDAISNITITDNRPNTTYVTPDSQWTSNLPLTITNASDPYTWNYNGSLAAGQTLYLYITWHISNSPSAIWTYINEAWISYVANATTKTGNAQALSFAVSTTPSATMGFEKRIMQYGNNPWDPVVFELRYQNNGNTPITNFDVVDYWPGTLNFVSASPMPATQLPSIGWSELHWIFTSPLAAGASGTITINGTIK